MGALDNETKFHRASSPRSTCNGSKRMKVIVIGDGDNNLAELASHEIDIKCNSYFDISYYSAPNPFVNKSRLRQGNNQLSAKEASILEHHYDILIAVGLDAIQRLSKLPSYDKILFWDMSDTQDEQEALSENVNFFLSRYFYG